MPNDVPSGSVTSVYGPGDTEYTIKCDPGFLTSTTGTNTAVVQCEDPAPTCGKCTETYYKFILHIACLKSNSSFPDLLIVYIYMFCMKQWQCALTGVRFLAALHQDRVHHC